MSFVVLLFVLLRVSALFKDTSRPFACCTPMPCFLVLMIDVTVRLPAASRCSVSLSLCLMSAALLRLHSYDLFHVLVN